MANIKSIINMHNKEVMTEKKIEAVKCNWINKPDCPNSDDCQTKTINIKQKLHQTLEHIMKIYTTEPVKLHLNSVMETKKKSFNHQKHRADQSFQRNTGDSKTSKQNPEFNFTFKKIPTEKRNRFLLLVLKRKTIYHRISTKQASKPKKWTYL